MGIRTEQVTGLQAAINAAYNQAITFSSSIPFDKPLTTMAYTITTNTSLTPNAAGALPGAGVILRVNGSNGSITFNSPFRKDNGSLTFDISAAQDNIIYMWFDGVDYWYKISRQWSDGTVVAAPVLSTLNTATDGSYIDIKFNKSMANPSGKHSQFGYTISGSAATFTAAALKSGDDTTIRLTCNTVINTGTTILLTYTPGNIVALDGGVLVAFSNTAVTNNVPGVGSSIPFYSSWLLIVDPTDSSKITRTGGNVITRIDSSAATTHFFTGGTLDYDPTNKVITHATGAGMTADSSILAPVSGDYSCAFKMKFPPIASVTSYNGVLRSTAGTSNALRFTYNATPSQWNLRVGTAADFFSSSTGGSGITNDLAYHYVVFTKTGTTYKCWVDGALKSSAGGTTPSSAFSSTLNAIFAATAPASPVSIKWLSYGEYIADADIPTVNTFLAAL